MKHYLAIFVLLCTISTAEGAHFSYYGGGLRAFYEVYAENPPYTDGRSEYQDGTNSASVAGSAVVLQANSYASSVIASKSLGNSIRIKSESTANGYGAYGTCYARGQASGSTQNSQTKGIFYMIMPDANEQTGDDVMVYYNDMLYVWSNGTTYVRIDGPETMNHLAITRGLLPPVAAEPASEYEVLRFPQVEISNSGGDLFGGVHAFPAKIGDVIGIFADNYAKVEGSAVSGEVYSMHTMILTVRAVLAGDLDYDGDVDFFDLAKLASNWLVGVGVELPIDTTPPIPNPMQWATGGEPKEIGSPPFNISATMTAAIATDPSGGIQYYFECTDLGGLSSDWQGSASYTVLVGGSGQGLHFTVKARDIHGNETNPSDPPLPAN